MKRRRLLKDYMTLFRDPFALFAGVKVTLWPNGQPEIWLQTEDGLGFRIRASRGPAGMSLTVERFTFGLPATLSGNVGKDYDPLTVDDVRELAVTQYLNTPKAQAFKAWYQSDVADSAQREALRAVYEAIP